MLQAEGLHGDADLRAGLVGHGGARGRQAGQAGAVRGEDDAVHGDERDAVGGRVGTERVDGEHVRGHAAGDVVHDDGELAGEDVCVLQGFGAGAGENADQAMRRKVSVRVLRDNVCKTYSGPVTANASRIYWGGRSANSSSMAAITSLCTSWWGGRAKDRGSHKVTVAAWAAADACASLISTSATGEGGGVLRTNLICGGGDLVRLRRLACSTAKRDMCGPPVIRIRLRRAASR